MGQPGKTVPWEFPRAAPSGTPKGQFFPGCPLCFSTVCPLQGTRMFFCFFLDIDDAKKYDHICLENDFFGAYKLYTVDHPVSWHPTGTVPGTGSYWFHPEIYTVTNKSLAFSGLKLFLIGPPNHHTLRETIPHHRESVS